LDKEACAGQEIIGCARMLIHMMLAGAGCRGIYWSVVASIIVYACWNLALRMEVKPILTSVE
jgi:hypothetical protein